MKLNAVKKPSAARRVVMAILATVPMVAWAAGFQAFAADPEPVPPPPAPTLIAPPAASTAPRDLAGIDTPQGMLGYALGLRIGSRIAADFKAQHPDVEPTALARGLADAILESKPLLGEEQMSRVLDEFDAAMREREKEFAKRMAEVAKANLVKARDFLRTNAAKPGVVALPSGLQYEVLKTGAGEQPTIDDTVSTHYRGTHLDGSEFDGTDPQGEPATFPLRGVVPGWQEALPLMKVGSKWKLYVPPELGYGEEGSPPVIEPNEVLVFEIELVRITPRR